MANIAWIEAGALPWAIIYLTFKALGRYKLALCYGPLLTSSLAKKRAV